MIVRGNSGAGKSTVARAVRAVAGRGVALVEQDYLRRVVLRERLCDGNLHIHLIESVVRIALDGGYDVVLEGIFHRDGYGDMLRRLRSEHRGSTWAFYLEVSFEESCSRHATRPQASEFTVDDMRDWFVPDDALAWDEETIIPASSSEAETVRAIVTAAQLGRG